MKVRKLLFNSMLTIGTILSITSCSSEAENVLIGNKDIDDYYKVSIIDDEGKELILESSDKKFRTTYSIANKFMPPNTRIGVVQGNKTGYDLKKKIGNTLISFGGRNPDYPYFSGQYIAEIYEYSFEVIVQPPGSIFVIPSLHQQNVTNMGFANYPTTDILGYDKTLMWADQYCDIYKIHTIVFEITHNILGQQVTRTLYPSSAKSPNNFYFEYYWITR